MTIATVEKLMNLRRGWKISMFQPARDISLKGEVTEVTENGFRLGVDTDSTYEAGKSLWFDHDKAVNDHWDVTVTDRSGELTDVEVIGEIGNGNRALLEELSHEDPVQSIPSNTTMVERAEGYDQPVEDDDVARSLAGARLDDEAFADAERDNAAAKGLRLIVTIHLPMGASEVGRLMMEVGTLFQSAVWKQGPGEQEMRIYASEEEVSR